MRKRFSTRLICLAIAAIMLTGTIAVAAINGSAYEALKTSIFDAMFFDNFTAELEVGILIDGQVYDRHLAIVYITEDAVLQFDSISGPYVATDEFFTNNLGMPDNSLINSIFLEADGLTMRRTHTITSAGNVLLENGRSQCGEIWYDVRWISPYHNRVRSFATGLGISDRNGSHMRLLELGLDMLIGDLRNNVVSTNYGDMQRISGAVSGNQLPEFVNILLEIFVEGARPNNYIPGSSHSTVLSIPLNSVEIIQIQGTADICNDGKLRYISCTAIVMTEDVYGTVRELTFLIRLRLSDIGTTNILEIFPFAHALIADDFLVSHFGFNWSRAYFTLDRYGNINPDSVTENIVEALRGR